MNTAKRLDNNLYLRVLQSGHLTIAPDWWRFHYTNELFWRLYRNEQDGASVTVDGKTIPLRAEWFYIIPSHLSLDLACEGRIDHFYIHFDIVGLPEIALRELFHEPFGQPGPPHWIALIREAAGIPAPADVAAQCQIKGVLYEALAGYLQTIPAAQIERCWHLAERVKPVLPALAYVETHLGGNLSNSVLARVCSMSDGHFIRTFRACMEQTPAQYVIECRVKAALRSLLLTSETIEQIADRHGFGSRHYFSRIFARQTGQSPAAFRRKQHH